MENPAGNSEFRIIRTIKGPKTWYNIEQKPLTNADTWIRYSNDINTFEDALFMYNYLVAVPVAEVVWPVDGEPDPS